MRVEYTITEYDADDEQVHQEQGTDDPRYGDVEDYARGLVTEWVPVEAATETWRARVRDADGNRAEAIGPSNEAWTVEPAPLPDGKALAAGLNPLATKLRTLAAPLATREDLPALPAAVRAGRRGPGGAGHRWRRRPVPHRYRPRQPGIRTRPCPAAGRHRGAGPGRRTERPVNETTTTTTTEAGAEPAAAATAWSRPTWPTRTAGPA